MLRLLHIENIAVIERADILFERGFNVMTGETGAGKSIVIDAISAILGERAYRDMIPQRMDGRMDRLRRRRTSIYQRRNTAILSRYKP